ncbi:unnamed protein product, partial [Mesorhabditis belari]|uniref:Probable glycerol kinase n=1 Tax=Mesorhabditis belari TaxID=2138241 RepID=A0AAF3J2P3_9BILA
MLLGAIDQGTSSSRFLLFDADNGDLLASHQIEVRQLFPHPGWVEMCPKEIYETVLECIKKVSEKMVEQKVGLDRLKCVGIANQRETTVVWDRETGEPLHNAIVWLDTRTSALADEAIQKTESKSKEHFKAKTGLPIHPYFSVLKLQWLLRNVPEVEEARKKGTLMFGTVDCWLLWKLCGIHATDVTNASRTMMFDLHKRKWSSELANFFEIPMEILPKIRSSAEVYGEFLGGPLKGIPISGCLGDQQAAMVGHGCLQKGDTKNTYGTGTFMLSNIGSQPLISKNGLLTTVGYQFGSDCVIYALEGSGSIGGNVIRFLRDNFGFIKDSSEVEALCRSITSTEGVIFVPAFTGLYTPYWDPTARGTICGLTQIANRAHITLAALRAVCFQSAEMLEAVEQDMEDTKITAIKVDGGMTSNILFNELQADIMGRRIDTPSVHEVSGWGAAMAAGIGIGLMKPENLSEKQAVRSYSPRISDSERHHELHRWKDAVKRACGWAIDEK